MGTESSSWAGVVLLAVLWVNPAVVVNILIWHVHGSWTTAFVQGRHRYLLPTLPERGPWGGGRPAAWDWPAAAVEVAPDQLADSGRRRGAAAARGVRAGRRAGWAAPPAGTCRRCSWSTTRRAGRPRQPAPDGRPGRPDAGARHPLQRADVGQRAHPDRGRRARHRRPRIPLHRRAARGRRGDQRAAAPAPGHRHRPAARAGRGGPLDVFGMGTDASARRLGPNLRGCGRPAAVPDARRAGPPPGVPAPDAAGPRSGCR